MIINHASLSRLFTVYNAAFKAAFAGANITWPSLATEVSSTSESNSYAWLGQFPGMREWLGDRIVKNMVASNYTITNKNWESTVEVSRPNIEDDQYGIYSNLMSAMGDAGAKLPDERMYTKILAGHTELCYDGQGFFDTDHPVIVNGLATVATNYDAVGAGAMWCLFDTTRPLKPMIWQKRKAPEFVARTSITDDNVFTRNAFAFGADARGEAGFGFWQMGYASLNTLNGTNVDIYETRMMQLKSDEGKPLGISPNVLVCGPSNAVAARNLLQMPFLAGGASNPHFQRFELIVSKYMV